STATAENERPVLESPLAHCLRRATTPRRPIRVCFMIDELTPAGTETQLVALIRNLNRTHVQPFLCLLRERTPESRLLEPLNCPVFHVGIRSFSRPSVVAKTWRLARFLRRERIDVLQVYFPESTYLAVPLARL